MEDRNAIARRAGVVYFIFMVVAILGEFVIPNPMVAGDAAATARNILASGVRYRLSILVGFVTLLLHIFLIVNLYLLFRNVDRGLALTMLLLVVVGVAVSLANLLSRFAPLVLLSGADYLSAFSQAQREALALGFLRLRGAATGISLAFWGLWLFPFGLLVIRSGFLPRLLGYLLLVAGFAYLASSFTSLVLPEHRGLVSRVMMPLYIGEVPIVFWLLLKGARGMNGREREGGAS